MPPDTSFEEVFDLVKARLREAAQSLKRMKTEKWDYPSERMAWWPDVVIRASEGYADSSTGAPRSSPPPDAIDRMEEVLGWMLWLDQKDYRQLVWLRAQKRTWRQMETVDGRSRVTLRKKHDKALAVIVTRLLGQRDGK